MRCVKKCANCIFVHPHSYTKAMWDVTNYPPMGPRVPAGDPYEITTFLASQRVLAGDPHGIVHAPSILGWAMALIPFVTTNSQKHNIVRFLLPQTRLPRWSPILVLLSHKHCVKNGTNIHISTFSLPYPSDMGRHMMGCSPLSIRYV
jgi:hypothetical protein